MCHRTLSLPLQTCLCRAVLLSRPVPPLLDALWPPYLHHACEEDVVLERVCEALRVLVKLQQQVDFAVANVLPLVNWFRHNLLGRVYKMTGCEGASEAGNAACQAVL